MERRARKALRAYGAGKAEREGFEPSRRLNTAYAISNPKPPVPLRAGPYR